MTNNQKIFPKITIVTVCFNSEKTIKKTLESVKDQTWKNIEHIIVDGKSTDKTLSILEEYPHISKIISEADKGIYDAMNKGICKSSGDIIGFLNSDDWFYDKTILEEIAYEFAKNQIDAVYGDLLFVDNENSLKSNRIWISQKYEKNFFSKGWVPPHPTFYAKLSLYKKYGVFDANLKFAADFDIMCRFIECHEIEIKYLPGIKVKMRLGGTTTKNISNIIKGNIEIYNSLKKNNVKIGLFFFLKKFLLKLKQLKSSDI